jgi:exoribonuclease-2
LFLAITIKGQSMLEIQVQAGQICGLFEQDNFCLGLVMSVADNICQVSLSDGRQLTLPIKRLVISSRNSYNTGNPITLLNDFTSQVNNGIKQFHPEQIWQQHLGKADSMALDELIAAMGLAGDEVTRFSLFLALRECPACFKAREGIYSFRTEDEHARLLEEEQQKRRDEAYYSEVKSWLLSLPDFTDVLDENTTYPAPREQIRPRLEKDVLTFQHGRFPESFSRILRSVNPAKPYPEWLLLIRQALGQIDKTTPLLIASSNLPHIFPIDVRSSACSIPEYTHELSGKDLRELDCHTIDAAGTFDMDDAVSLRKTNDGWQFGIHISDVDFFVKPGSVTDREALKRTSSIYLPETDIHMLPECLSCNKASLLSGQERPALSLLFAVNSDYEIVGSELLLSTIRVSSRLTYEELESLLSLKSGEPDDEAEWVRVIGNIAERHLHKRLENGAVVFPDSSQTPARRTIAECMVIYNSFLADYARKHRLPFFFRCQEEPLTDPDSDDESWQYLVPPSVIGTKPLPHRAMGLPVYAQVSSPLRRYSDLANQRQIIAHLSAQTLPYTVNDLQSMLSHLLLTRQTIRRVTLQSEQQMSLGLVANSFLHYPTTAVVIRQAKGRTSLYLPEFDCRISAVLPGKVKPGTELRLKITALQPESGFASVLAEI